MMKRYEMKIVRPIDWQRNKAPKITKIVQSKQDWYERYKMKFWNDWRKDVFDLKTANDFGLVIWCNILNVPAQAFVFGEHNNYWAFGDKRKNFFAVNTGIGSTKGGNFTDGGLSGLNTEEARKSLRMRYYSLILNNSVPAINAALLDVFGRDDNGLSNAYVIDNNDMTMTYVHKDYWSRAMVENLIKYDIMPRPGTVKITFEDQSIQGAMKWLVNPVTRTVHPSVSYSRQGYGTGMNVAGQWETFGPNEIRYGHSNSGSRVFYNEPEATNLVSFSAPQNTSDITSFVSANQSVATAANGEYIFTVSNGSSQWGQVDAPNVTVKTLDKISGSVRLNWSFDKPLRVRIVGKNGSNADFAISDTTIQTSDKGKWITVSAVAPEDITKLSLRFEPLESISNGETITATEVQLVAGEGQSLTYIPTNGFPATRAADEFWIDTAAAGIGKETTIVARTARYADLFQTSTLIGLDDSVAWAKYDGESSVEVAAVHNHILRYDSFIVSTSLPEQSTSLSVPNPYVNETTAAVTWGTRGLILASERGGTSEADYVDFTPPAKVRIGHNYAEYNAPQKIVFLGVLNRATSKREVSEMASWHTMLE